MIVGAYAVSFHSHPRTTGDIDVWIEPTLENATKVMTALSESSARSSAVTPWSATSALSADDKILPTSSYWARSNLPNRTRPRER
jgi:hypothetical protein